MEMIVKYFYISWIEKDNIKAARAPEGTLSFELAKEIKGKDELPFVIHLDDDEKLVDYLPNTIAWPLMSEKLKNIIIDHLTGKEGLSWIVARVRHGDFEIKYYIPKFNQSLDVLEASKTIFAGKDFIVKAHLSLNKVKNYSFFPIPDLPFTSRIVVSEELKQKIEKSCLTGINFEKVAAS
jgi:hypothetical protein